MADVLNAVTQVVSSPSLNTIALAVAGYYLRDTALAIKEMRKEIEAHKLRVAEDYATREDVVDAIERHESLLHAHGPHQR